MNFNLPKDLFSFVLVIIFSAWFLGILFFYLKRKILPGKLIFWGIIFFFIVTPIKAISQASLTYLSWKSHPIGQYLLPPYQSTYFLRYSFFHYLFGPILAIAGSLIILFFLFLLRKKLERGGLSLGFFGSLVSGWPNLIIYFGFALLIALSFGIFKKRINFTLSLIFAVILVLIFGNYLNKWLGLAVLRI